MIGEQVIVKLPSEVGRDEHNNPVISMEPKECENVLVAPTESEVIGGSTRPEGAYVRYSLCFPKTWTESLEGCLICVRGEWLDVIGAPDYYDPKVCPTDWNRMVYVGVTHG